jgi:hypothetical protein
MAVERLIAKSMTVTTFELSMTARGVRARQNLARDNMNAEDAIDYGQLEADYIADDNQAMQLLLNVFEDDDDDDDDDEQSQPADPQAKETFVLHTATTSTPSLTSSSRALVDDERSQTSSTSTRAFGAAASPVIITPTHSSVNRTLKKERDIDPSSGLEVTKRCRFAAAVHANFQCRLLAPSLAKLMAQEFAFVKLTQMPRHHKQTSAYHGREAFTIGVLSNKSLPKTAKGKSAAKFVVWKFVDLTKASIAKPFTLFVFGSAFESWWKELEGSVMCILRPEPLDANADESAYKVTHEEQLQKMGMAANYSVCHGKRRDGAACTMPIDRSVSNYCEYHAPAALRQVKRAASAAIASRNASATAAAAAPLMRASTPIAPPTQSVSVTSGTLQSIRAAAGIVEVQGHV